jgi:hypothetical protein
MDIGKLNCMIRLVFYVIELCQKLKKKSENIYISSLVSSTRDKILENRQSLRNVLTSLRIIPKHCYKPSELQYRSSTIISVPIFVRDYNIFRSRGETLLFPVFSFALWPSLTTELLPQIYCLRHSDTVCLALPLPCMQWAEWSLMCSSYFPVVYAIPATYIHWATN